MGADFDDRGKYAEFHRIIRGHKFRNRNGKTADRGLDDVRGRKEWNTIPAKIPTKRKLRRRRGR